LRTLVLFIEHVYCSRKSASVRRPQFACEPAHCIRFEGIRCNDPYLNLVAFGTFEQPVFEADWPRRNAFKHHPRVAARTAGALDIGQELIG
jgi:hypothetical protein